MLLGDDKYPYASNQISTREEKNALESWNSIFFKAILGIALVENTEKRHKKKSDKSSHEMTSNRMKY